MMAAALLLSYAALAAAAGTWWLPRARWPFRAPRAGIALWQALTLTVVISPVLGALFLAVPCLNMSAGPAGPPPGTAAVAAGDAVPAGVAGALLALAVLGRLACVTGSALAVAARQRARHGDVLAVVAHPGPVPGSFLLDDDHPVAYCLPGRGRIVLTTGALRRLDGRQLAAVLAHERAHLSGRHHLVLLSATILRRAFPRARVFAVAADQVGALVEMAADDTAARRTHRLALAGALLALASARIPAGMLGAAGTAAARRVRRLIEPARPRPGMRSAGISAAALTAAAALVLSAPAFAYAIACACCGPCWACPW